MPKLKPKPDLQDISTQRLVDYCRSRPDAVVEYLETSWLRACECIIDSTGIAEVEKMIAVMRVNQGRKAALEEMIQHIASECRKADEPI